MSSNEHAATATNEPIDVRNGNLSHNIEAQDTASLASPTFSTASSATRTSFKSHGRALSMATENGHTVRPNRFSIQFPIQTSYAAYAYPPARTSISPVREQVTTASPTSEVPSAPSDGNYLHLIAASERRVLELKEELQKAEADLNKLKRDWARHEATKKREDARRNTRLEPLQTALPAMAREDDLDGSSAWMQQEMERRKALMSASRTSNRTVFPGQRHTRALSLLSPRGDGPSSNTASTTPRLPPRKESLQNPVRQSAEFVEHNRPVLKPRSSTTSNLSPGESPGPIDPTQQQVLDHDALLRAGKKYATDFKDGLWTFWEDIRQATVGEEAETIQPPPRKKSSTQTLRGAKKQSSRSSLKDSSRSSSTTGKGKKKTQAALPDLADPSFWTDHGIPAPAPVVTKKSPTSKPHNHTESLETVASSEPWDTWDDSPVQSRSSSSVTSENTTLPSTVSGSPRPSMHANRESKDLSKKEAIPWPVLKKSGLGSLRRTASHLLSEWEKSLTPSPGQEWSGQGDDYMGASAEAAAYGASKGKHD